MPKQEVDEGIGLPSAQAKDQNGAGHSKRMRSPVCGWVRASMLSATMLGVIFVPIFFVWVLSLLRTKPQQTDNHPLHKAE